VSAPQATSTLELSLCAFAAACLRACGAGRLDDALVALAARALVEGDAPGERAPAPRGPWTMERVTVALPQGLLAEVERVAGGDGVEEWLRGRVHAWVIDDVPCLGDVGVASTMQLCVSSLDLMSVRQRIGNATFLGRAHAVDEAARHWLDHRARADRARALTLYLDGSHHFGVLTVAVDPELITRIIELADDDAGHVVDAIYWGLAHMLGHIS